MTSLAAWLADSGLRNLPLEELVDGFSRRLNGQGVPVARAFVGMNTLHPMIRARSLIWDRATGIAAHFEFQHAEIDLAVIRESPFAVMIEVGEFEKLVDLAAPPVMKELPLFGELRAAGMTAWLGRIFPLGELPPQVGDAKAVERVGELWMVSSFATDRPGGFDAAALTQLNEYLPLFALAVKATTARAIGHGLLAAYLGADPAERVFAGTVQRGEVQSVEAVLFYADLRSFTELADTMPGRELIHLLDDCFDCMARPVTRHGGEILKFTRREVYVQPHIRSERLPARCIGVSLAHEDVIELEELRSALILGGLVDDRRLAQLARAPPLPQQRLGAIDRAGARIVNRLIEKDETVVLFQRPLERSSADGIRHERFKSCQVASAIPSSPTLTSSQLRLI